MAVLVSYLLEYFEINYKMKFIMGAESIFNPRIRDRRKKWINRLNLTNGLFLCKLHMTQG